VIPRIQLRRFGYEAEPQPTKLQTVIDGLGLTEDEVIARICAPERKEN